MSASLAGRRKAFVVNVVMILRAQRVFLADFLRVALENCAPALRIGGHRALERTFDEHLAHVRVERVTGNRPRRVHRALERFVDSGVGQIAGREECHADAVQAGLDGQGRRLAAITAFAWRSLCPSRTGTRVCHRR